MKARLAVVVLPLFAFLVGCFGQDSDGDRGDADVTLQDSFVVPWGLTDCVFAIGAIPVPSDRVAARLPEGFEPANVFGTAGLLVGSAALRLEAASCREGTTLANVTPDMQYATVSTLVEPPDALRLDGVDEYSFSWDILVPDQDRRARLAEAGMSVRGGEAVVYETNDPEVDAAASGAWISMQRIGNFGWQAQVVKAGSVPNEPRPFVNFMDLTNGGLAAWQGQRVVTTAYRGEGAFELPAGTYLAELVGAPYAWGTTTAGTMSLAGGSITWPVDLGVPE